jgi:hypothetical protein
MTKITKILISLVLLLVALPSVSLWVLTTQLSSGNISYPAKDHSHFRLQYVYHGVPQNLADSKYQTPYDKGQCDGSLTKEPIHLHDKKNQIVHFHWARITGGQVLKNYGVNLIGGQDDVLGYKLDQISNLKIQPVPIFGKVLPQPNNEDKIWVYTGEPNKNMSRTIEDFKTQDIETFLGKDSQVRKDEEKYGDKTSFLGSVVASAHGDERLILADLNTAPTSSSSTPTTAKSNKTEEELKQINNLLGNIVLFVQPDEPTQNQVEERFANLEPLSDSVCGG